MPVNIGWCDGLTYPARSIKVRFTQNETGIKNEITLNQLAGQENGNSPYFQWGRKDPFVGLFDGNINKTWYDSDGVEQVNKLPAIGTWTGSDNAAAIKAIVVNGISNPGTFCRATTLSSFYYNLWSAKNETESYNDNTVIKTIYDPSPVGYHMPASNVFTGFTSTGESKGTPQGNWDGVSKSWNFVKNGNSINFPALGSRSSSSASGFKVGESGYYLSAGLSSGKYGQCLEFSTNSVNPMQSYITMLGCSVRCVQQ